MSVSQWIYLFIIISMTIVIMFILLHFFSRPYIQAVKSITGVMSCVEQGEFDHQLRVNPHLPMEIQQISSGFNEMVAHLEMLIAKVKQAVLDQKNAELSALEAQIDPHFLYNTLDTINWKAIENEQYEISGMVGALADILRYTVKNAGGTASISERNCLAEAIYYAAECKIRKASGCKDSYAGRCEGMQNPQIAFTAVCGKYDQICIRRSGNVCFEYPHEEKRRTAAYSDPGQWTGNGSGHGSQT